MVTSPGTPNAAVSLLSSFIRIANEFVIFRLLSDYPPLSFDASLTQFIIFPPIRGNHPDYKAYERESEPDGKVSEEAWRSDLLFIFHKLFRYDSKPPNAALQLRRAISIQAARNQIT
jgi:hypothetical protein